RVALLRHAFIPSFCFRRFLFFRFLAAGAGGLFGGLLGLLGGFQGGHFLGGGLGVAGLHLGLGGLGRVVVVGAGHHRDPVGLAQAHDPDAAAVAALDVDVLRVHPDDDAFLAAEQHVVGVVHDL